MRIRITGMVAALAMLTLAATGGVARGDSFPPAPPAPSTAPQTSVVRSDDQSVTVATMKAVRSPNLGGPAPQISAGGPGVISCNLNVQNPHNSTHVPGSVNVVVTVQCTSQVAAIALRSALYYEGGLVSDSGSSTSTGVAFKQSNAAWSPCVSGSYVGWGSTNVQFPPGYTPASGSITSYGNTVSILC